MTRDEWNALAERCEKATGPDDYATIAETTSAVMAGLGYKLHLGAYWNEARVEWLTEGNRIMISLDAITALIERGLPGWGWFVVVPARGSVAKKIEGRVYEPRRLGSGQVDYLAHSATPALALCAALCLAMASKETA
jgi:hypothetical protein